MKMEMMTMRATTMDTAHVGVSIKDRSPAPPPAIAPLLQIELTNPCDSNSIPPSLVSTPHPYIA